MRKAKKKNENVFIFVQKMHIEADNSPTNSDFAELKEVLDISIYLFIFHSIPLSRWLGFCYGPRFKLGESRGRLYLKALIEADSSTICQRNDSSDSRINNWNL